jgi:hypothetical protein
MIFLFGMKIPLAQTAFFSREIETMHLQTISHFQL